MFGFWLVFIVPGWEFESVWITVGILVATVAVVIDLFYATPRGRSGGERSSRTRKSRTMRSLT